MLCSTFISGKCLLNAQIHKIFIDMIQWLNFSLLFFSLLFFRSNHIIRSSDMTSKRKWNEGNLLFFFELGFSCHSLALSIWKIYFSFCFLLIFSQFRFDENKFVLLNFCFFFCFSVAWQVFAFSVLNWKNKIAVLSSCLVLFIQHTIWILFLFSFFFSLTSFNVIVLINTYKSIS